MILTFTFIIYNVCFSVQELKEHIENIEQRFGPIKPALNRTRLNPNDVSGQLMEMIPGAFPSTNVDQPQSPIEISEDISEPISEDISDPIAKNIAENVSDPIAEDISDPIAENMAENISENITENTAEDVDSEKSQTVGEIMSMPLLDSCSEDVLDIVASSLPQPQLPQRARKSFPNPMPFPWLKMNATQNDWQKQKQQMEHLKRKNQQLEEQVKMYKKKLKKAMAKNVDDEEEKERLRACIVKLIKEDE